MKIHRALCIVLVLILIVLLTVIVLHSVLRRKIWEEMQSVQAKVEVEGWPVNSAVELTMMRRTSVDKVRNGWVIEAADLD